MTLINRSLRRARRALVAVALVCAVFGTGCSREPERGPVSGVVTLDGKPLPDVMVVFVPDPEFGTAGPRSLALTDKEGRYVMYTDKDENGASVGAHRVSLYDPMAPTSPGGFGLLVLPDKGQERSHESKSRIPAAYGDAIKTPLQPVEVGSTAQTYDIHLKSK